MSRRLRGHSKATLIRAVNRLAAEEGLILRSERRRWLPRVYAVAGTAFLVGLAAGAGLTRLVHW